LIGISAINAESAVSYVLPGAEIKPFKGEDPGFPPEQIRPREGIFYSKVEQGIPQIHLLITTPINACFTGFACEPVKMFMGSVPFTL